MPQSDGRSEHRAARPVLLNPGRRERFLTVARLPRSVPDWLRDAALTPDAVGRPARRQRWLVQ